MQVLAFDITRGQRPSFGAKGRRGLTRAGGSIRPGHLVVAALLLAAELLWPLGAFAHLATSPGPVPLAAAELQEVTGGCLYNCGGDDDSDSGSSSSSPSKTGSPYWEYAYRTLISRPSVAGDLIWHRVNDTDQYWGPFDVTYRYHRTFNWSLGGSVPRSFVQAHIGGAYETSKTLVERFTIPPRTYYKFFVAYPYERWRYYYRRYQDYSDDSRDVVGKGDATVYDQWTKTTLVQGRLY
jgi:hypothetical protein